MTQTKQQGNDLSGFSKSKVFSALCGRIFIGTRTCVKQSHVATDVRKRGARRTGLSNSEKDTDNESAASEQSDGDVCRHEEEQPSDDESDNGDKDDEERGAILKRRMLSVPCSRAFWGSLVSTADDQLTSTDGAALELAHLLLQFNSGQTDWGHFSDLRTLQTLNPEP